LPGNTLQKARRGGNGGRRSTNTLERQLREALTGRLGIRGGVPPPGDQRKDAEKATITRAISLVHEGHVRRAVKGLLSEATIELSDEKTEILKKLHPLGPTNLRACPEDAPRIVTVDKEIIRDIINKEMANGAAPGKSGWTGD